MRPQEPPRLVPVRRKVNERSILGHGEVEFREITFETVRNIVALDVRPEQRIYVASNSVSLAEAHFNPGAWFRAIHLGDEPVGFVMLFDPSRSGAISKGAFASTDIGLWRLMIDGRYQAQGIGRVALDLVRKHVRSHSSATRLVSSFIEGEDGPEKFYLKYGFERTGLWRANGTEIEIWIEP